MALTFLQQLITVGCLAFASGLLLGIAFFRGEIGNLGGVRFAAPVVSPSDSSAMSAPGELEPTPDRRRRKPPPSLGDVRRAVVDNVRDMDPALTWVLIALAILLLSSAVITRLAA